MTKFQKQMMTIAAIGALSAVTALPAMAGEATPYASIRMSTFWNINEKAATGTNQGYDEHLQANARLGVNFKNDNITGKAELGAGSGTDTVGIRLLYGAWDFGSGKLVIGQDWNRYYTFPTQVAKSENLLNGYGNLWDGRTPQIRVDMKNGAYVSFMQPFGNVAAGEQESTSTSFIINNTLGALLVKDLLTGVEFGIGSGFNDAQRKEIWENRYEWIGKIVKYKHFAVGAVEAPRFPIFISGAEFVGERHVDDL